MPTPSPRHSIIETPALADALESLRLRLGDRAPGLEALALRGAEATLRELDVREGLSQRGLATFVERLTVGLAPDLSGADRIRHASSRVRKPGAA